MSQEQLTEFSGVVGVVLRRSVSWTSAVTGLFLGFVFMVLVFLFTVLGSPSMLSLATQIIVAFVLARFAVNGIFGEWGGTMFSNAGGNWTQVGAVAARYLTLTALWLLPLFFLGLFSQEAQMDMAGSLMAPAMGMETGMSPGSGAGKTIGLFMVYMIGSVLSPPLFLIVSVSASGFGDVFSPDHWRQQFSGRAGDLFLVYAAYAGALGMVMVLGIPILLGLTAVAWQFALLVGIVGGAFTLGLALNLLGRLCGFFAFGESGFVPAAAPTGGEPTHVNAVSPRPEAPPAPEPAPGPASVPVSAEPGPGEVLAATPQAEPGAQEAGSAAGIHGPGPDAATQGLPPLNDASERVQAARRRFGSDPARAIRMLEELRESHAPHPQVLHALVLMNHESGETERAMEVARDAMPLLFQRGNNALAAQIFKMFWKRRNELELDRDQVLGIAGALARTEDLALSANTYALVLQKDKRDPRAIKGILQIADGLLRERQKPEDALRLYQYLMKTCPESPLADYTRQGMDEAQKRIDQPKAS